MRQPNEWDALLEELKVTEDPGDCMNDLEDFYQVNTHQNKWITTSMVVS
jgi:hypothetical protein